MPALPGSKLVVGSLIGVTALSIYVFLIATVGGLFVLIFGEYAAIVFCCLSTIIAAGYRHADNAGLDLLMWLAVVAVAAIIGPAGCYTLGARVCSTEAAAEEEEDDEESILHSASVLHSSGHFSLTAAVGLWIMTYTWPFHTGSSTCEWYATWHTVGLVPVLCTIAFILGTTLCDRDRNEGGVMSSNSSSWQAVYDGANSVAYGILLGVAAGVLLPTGFPFLSGRFPLTDWG